MSIINDALKKAQEKLRKQTSSKYTDKTKKNTTEDNPQSPNIPAPQKEPTPSSIISSAQQTSPLQQQAPSKPMPEFSPSTDQGPLPNSPNQNLVIILLIILILTLLAINLPTMYKNMQPHKSDQPPNLSTVPETQAPINPQPVQWPPTEVTKNVSEKKPSQGLKVSGISIIGEKKIVIINNEIYEVGDMVENLIVKQINLKEVILLDPKGKALKLKVQ